MRRSYVRFLVSTFALAGAAAAVLALVPSHVSAQGRKPTAKPAAATATPTKLPEIVVGGIQVAKVVVAEDDWSAKPFNSSNGTKLVLWIKMPPNLGLIEIDDDASMLEHFGDDKGSDLGGSLDSFPDEFKDGSGATMEVSSDGLPAAGATALSAKGTLVMNVATGTKPQRVSNVRIENDKTFKLAQATLTLSDVVSEDGELKFTLKLPRQTMNGIKTVKFLDGRGQELEGNRTGSGYMNDDAEMSFTVKTDAKTLGLEFETWQGLREMKVPFDVTAGVGLR